MIISNWKMNGSKKLIDEWIDFVSQNLEIDEKKECIFCPPISYLDQAKSLLQRRCVDIKLGSQQIDSNLHNPLTGGINSEMLIDLGCEFVIIGHSEQRMRLKESNLILSDKLQSSLEMDIKPIFCIGESLEQKNKKITKEVLSSQLNAIPDNLVHECVIAYEPVWAIGTGENATKTYIEDIHSFIREELGNRLNSINNISVVYGGSVNLENYNEIYSSPQVDGLLIGGASLDAETFTKIYNNK